jgi:hypothetical protein
MIMRRYPRVILVAVAFSFGVALSSSQEVLRTEVDKPAVPSQPRTINLTQEQRFIIKENVKDLHLSKARKDAPETIGDPVPPDIEQRALQPVTFAGRRKSSGLSYREGPNAAVEIGPDIMPVELHQTGVS